jgi:hypothetical protein
MKTLQLFFLLAFIIPADGSKAQSINNNSICRNLAPVYYNFYKRQLFYNGCEKLAGADFLETCRSIKDSAVQAEVARYDQFSNNKYKMGIIAISAGTTGLGLMISSETMGGNQASDQLVRGTLVTAAVIGILTIPVMAIASSVPHQRRKEVLFRDLPIAYNNYVESLTTKK